MPFRLIQNSFEKMYFDFILDGHPNIPRVIIRVLRLKTWSKIYTFKQTANLSQLSRPSTAAEAGFMISFQVSHPVSVPKRKSQTSKHRNIRILKFHLIYQKTTQTSLCVTHSEGAIKIPNTKQR